MTPPLLGCPQCKECTAKLVAFFDFGKKNENVEENYNFSSFLLSTDFLSNSRFWGPDLRLPASPFIGGACRIPFRLSGGGLMDFVPGFREITGKAGF